MGTPAIGMLPLIQIGASIPLMLVLILVLPPNNSPHLLILGLDIKMLAHLLMDNSVPSILLLPTLLVIKPSLLTKSPNLVMLTLALNLKLKVMLPTLLLMVLVLMIPTVDPLDS